MANSVVTPTVTAHHAVGKWDLIIGTLAVGAGDLPAAGVTLDFSAVPEIKSSKPPVFLIAYGVAGYVYVYKPGTTKDNGTMEVFQSAGTAAPLAEVATTTPSGVVSDTIRFFALFPLLR